jgi:hypothetical protein
VSELPLLFLDVDGPLIPWDNDLTQRPDGYQTFRWQLPPSVKPDGQRDNGKRRAWLRPEHGVELLRLPVQLVWATSWGAQANERIGRHLGLPELPVATPVNQYRGRGPNQSWKTEILHEYADSRPFAWVDDEIFHNDVHYLTSVHAADVFLLPVDPKYGLAVRDFEVLHRWAECVSAVNAPGVSVASHREELLRAVPVI